MTIRVTVKNDDSRETAVIGVTTHWHTEDASGFPTDLGEDAEIELKGGPDGSGESVQLLVHNRQTITIREIRQ